MKRLFCLFLCFAFLFLSGCADNNIMVQTENLNFDFEISFNGSPFLMNARIDGGGDIVFTVLSPENIKGFTLGFSDSVVHAEFSELKKDFPLDNTDFGTLGDIYKAVSQLPRVQAVRQGEEFKAIISADGEEFVFTVTDLGIPISLSFSDNEILFKNIVTE